MLPNDQQAMRPVDDALATAREQAAILNRNTRSGTVANLGADAIAASALMTSTLPWTLIACWYAALVCTFVFRLWTIRLYRDGMDLGQCAAWLRVFTASTALRGVVWGTIGWAIFLHPGALTETLIVLALMGICGAASASFGAHFRSAAAFLLPALAPMTLHYVLHGTPVGWAIATLSLLYLLILTRVVRSREAAIHDSVAQDARSRELAEQLRIIADYSYAWENWFSEDGRLLWVNPSVERITGYSEAECHRMPRFPLEIIHPDDRDTAMSTMATSRRNGTDGCHECRILRKDGAVRWIVADWQPARDSQGGTVGVRVSIRDVTDTVELRERLELQATTDPLTGLMNRRRFFEVGESELYRSARFGRPVCVAIFDLDHFKRVNDTHGHAVGDLCLRAFVGAIQANIRQTDAFARFGGEEFTLLMPETSLEAAARLCDRLRQAVSAATVTAPGGAITITASAGVTVCGRAETSLDPALSRADAALYAAKNQGRDRVCASPLADTPPVAGRLAAPDGDDRAAVA